MSRSLRALRLVCMILRPDVGSSSPGLPAVGEQGWQDAMALANAHFVGPALYAALAQKRWLADVPADVRDYLALLHRCNVARNRRVRAQALEVVSALGSAGIDAILLKGGAALFLDREADWSARMLRDIDVLLPQDAAESAFDVLDRLGYHVIERYPAGHHAYGDFARQGDPAAVDLHFELIDTPHVLPARDVRQRAKQLVVDNTGLYVPSPTDRVLHHVLHAQVHYLANYYRGLIELRQLHEYATLARRDGGEIDWAFIADDLTRHRLRTPLYAYAWAATRLLGAPWTLPEPPPWTARLHLRRCLLQHQAPSLAQIAIPLANLRSAFAPSRMDGLYPHQSPLLRRRLRHAASFLGKRKVSDWIARLLRSAEHPRGWRR